MAPPAASGAAKDSLGKDPLEKLRQGVAAKCEFAIGVEVSAVPAHSWRSRHDPMPEYPSRSEWSVIGPAVLARMGDEHGETLYEGEQINN